MRSTLLCALVLVALVGCTVASPLANLQAAAKQALVKAVAANKPAIAEQSHCIRLLLCVFP
jgi:hypothetical protein